MILVYGVFGVYSDDERIMFCLYSKFNLVGLLLLFEWVSEWGLYGGRVFEGYVVRVFDYYVLCRF